MPEAASQVLWLTDTWCFCWEHRQVDINPICSPTLFWNFKSTRWWKMMPFAFFFSTNACRFKVILKKGNKSSNPLNCGIEPQCGGLAFRGDWGQSSHLLLTQTHQEAPLQHTGARAPFLEILNLHSSRFQMRSLKRQKRFYFSFGNFICFMRFSILTPFLFLKINWKSFSPSCDHS